MNPVSKPGLVSAHLSAVLPGFSVEQITLSGGNFVSGEVLGLNAAGDAYIKLDLNDAAGAGAEAVAVLWKPVDATDADMPAAAHVRMTMVHGDYLVWPDGIDGARTTALIADLALKNIHLR